MSAAIETPEKVNAQKRDTNVLRAFAIASGLCIAAGMGTLFVSTRDIVKGVKAEKWAQTEGVIKSVTEYQYSVGGKNFGGNTIHPAYGSGYPSEVDDQLIRLLKAGRRVRVYYNPVNPEESTLAAGFYSCSYEILSGGLAFFGFGLAVLLACWFAIKGSQDFAGGITIEQLIDK